MTPDFIEGLSHAASILRRTDDLECAKKTIARLLRQAKAQAKKEKLEAAQQFCGDPYAHDCGRTDCPTSDSYTGTKTLSDILLEGVTR